MSGILEFYLNNAVGPKGLTFDNCINMSNMELETRHDWIQWCFPLLEPSQCVKDAPVLEEQDRIEIIFDERFRVSQLKMFYRLLGFYRVFSKDCWWITPGNHNYLRLTRILKSMQLFGNESEAISFGQWLLGVPGIPSQTREYWAKAIARV